MADVFTPPTRAPLTVLAGSRGPENIIAERVKIDMADEIFSYSPNDYPFTVLTGKLRNTRRVENSQFYWMESDDYPRNIEVSATYAAGAATISVAAGDETRAAINYVYMNTRTREQFLVTGTSSGTLTVTSNIGSYGSVAGAVGDVLEFQASINEDGADISAARTTKDVPQYNYTEILRRPIDFTRRGMKTALFGGKDPVVERKRAGIEFARDIEQRLFFGQRASITGTHLRTFTGGLDYWIKSNVVDVSGIGGITERAFDEILEEGFRWGSNVKYFLASRRWITEINWWAKSKLEYRPLDSTIGFGAMEYNSPHGRVRIVNAPVLDYNHKDRAYLVDLADVRYVHFQDDDVHVLKDRGGNGVDGYKEELLADIGLELRLEAKHMRFQGLA